MKKLLFIGMACYGLSAGAQVRPSESFIYLFNDSVIHANRVTLRPDPLNSLQLRADSRRIPLHQVKFINNEDGFFANTRQQTFVGDTQFAERIIEGKINLFQEISYTPYQYDYGYRSSYRKHDAVNIHMYYNKGYDNLKKVSYNGLKEAMANNPQSMEFLKLYKKSLTTRNTLYAGAGLSLLASILAITLNTKRTKQSDTFTYAFGPSKEPNYVAGLALLGVGTGLAVGGYAIHLSGTRHLENAIDTYNR